MIYFIPTVSGADPKIQAVHGYWVGCEDKGISEQTLIQAPQISSPNIYFAAGNLYFNLSLIRILMDFFDIATIIQIF